MLELEGEDYLDWQWWARAFLMNVQLGQREGRGVWGMDSYAGSWVWGRGKESEVDREGTCCLHRITVPKLSQQWNSVSSGNPTQSTDEVLVGSPKTFP